VEIEKFVVPGEAQWSTAPTRLDIAYDQPERLLSKRPGYRVVVFLSSLREHLFTGGMVPKSNAARLAYVSEFIEEAKDRGLVKQTIERLALRGAQVVLAGQ
jgi:hypothetical protein